MGKLRNVFVIMSLVIFAIAVNGCGDDDDDTSAEGEGEGETGTAPAISDLNFEQTEYNYEEVKNQTILLKATMAFEDVDGDFKEVEMTVTLPTGTSQTLPRTQLAGIAGQTSGIITLTLQVNVSFAGEWNIDVAAFDEKGNKSNTLNTVITFAEAESNGQ